MITRTTDEDANLSGPGRPAAANRIASGVDDNYRRRRSTLTVAPRNML